MKLKMKSNKNCPAEIAFSSFVWHNKNMSHSKARKKPDKNILGLAWRHEDVTKLDWISILI